MLVWLTGAKQNSWFPRTVLPVEVKRTVFNYWGQKPKKMCHDLPEELHSLHVGWRNVWITLIFFETHQFHRVHLYGQSLFSLFLQTSWDCMSTQNESQFCLFSSTERHSCAQFRTFRIERESIWRSCFASALPTNTHAQMRTHTHDVETPLLLFPTTKTVVGVPPSVTQKVTWKDALFPRVVPTRVQCTPQ